LREKYRPIGAPDGGDGGDGGSVVFRCSSSVRDLNMKAFHIRAANGLPGAGKCKKGKDGADVVVHVPVGTVVKLFKRSAAAAAAAADAGRDSAADREWARLLRGRRELSLDDARAHVDDVDGATAFDAAVSAGGGGAGAAAARLGSCVPRAFGASASQPLMICAAAEVSAAYDAKVKQLLPAAVGLTLQAAREWGFRSVSCHKLAVVVVVAAVVEVDAVIVSGAIISSS
jgi:hypothetical protein